MTLNGKCVRAAGIVGALFIFLEETFFGNLTMTKIKKRLPIDRPACFCLLKSFGLQGECLKQKQRGTPGF